MLFRKSAYLPSLEVKVHAPDLFQPKVQAAIQELEAKREKKERELLIKLESSYNDELTNASNEISKIIKDSLSLFDNDNLLQKSIEFAITPPIVLLSKTTQEKMLKNQKKYNVPTADGEATMGVYNTIGETVPLPIDSLKKTKPILDIGNHESLTTDVGDEHPHFIQKDTLKNGPITKEYYDLLMKENKHIYSSFLQINNNKEGKYTKPISVEMKLPEEPNPKIKQEIEKIEKKRDGYEEKLFQQAAEEFKLITKITMKELQTNLKNELLPFYVVSKSTMATVDAVIAQNIKPPGPSQRFLQIDKEQFENDYGDLIKKKAIDIKNEAKFNRDIHSKLVNFFSLPTQDEEITNKYYNPNVQNEINEDNINLECEKLSKKYPELEIKCDDNNNIYTSFLETSNQEKGNDEDFINVKFGASDQSYPTIEKLVSQMMTRRDLAEKYIRLKILEYETRLQKAENEMIQDVLHETLYRIIAKYAPAIEGVKEHIK